MFGASLPRFRDSDFTVVEHLEGTSPAWPFSYADLEPYSAEAERIYRVHGTTAEDPSESWRSGPSPYPAMPHEPYIADLADRLRACGVHPGANAMAVDLRDGVTCVRCATCDGFPCRWGAKSDAETCAPTPRWRPDPRGGEPVGRGRRVLPVVRGDEPGSHDRGPGFAGVAESEQAA